MEYEDHPHAYGDKRSYVLLQFPPAGSSPRVWGQVNITLSPFAKFGIIPTRMGTRRLKTFVEVSKKDHPHAYGDKRLCKYTFSLPMGSSPRVWGQVCKTSAKLNEVRIIPTRMGTSLATTRQGLTKRDHPHAYGDKLSTIIICEHRIGSSPRVWGQVVRPRVIAVLSGIIPTRMGTSTAATVCLLCGKGSSPRVWGQV